MPREVRKKPGLLAKRQHQGRQLSEVALKRPPGHVHDVFRQLDAARALDVLHLKDGIVRLVVGAHVRPHHVREAVPAAWHVGRYARHQHRRAAHPEERVADEHAPLRAEVPVLGEVLRGHHQRPRAAVHLQQVPRQLHRNHPRGATHAAEVVRAHRRAQPVVVDNHGRQGRGGGEEGAVDNDNVNRRAGVQPRAGEELVDDAKDHLLRLLPRQV